MNFAEHIDIYEELNFEASIELLKKDIRLCDDGILGNRYCMNEQLIVEYVFNL